MQYDRLRMRDPRSAGAFVIVAIGTLAGCAASQPAPSPAPQGGGVDASRVPARDDAPAADRPARSASQTPAPAPAPVAIDLSPAPAPEGLVASVRVANPTATWQAVFKLLGEGESPLAAAGPAFIAGALFNAPPQLLDLASPLDALMRVRELPTDGNLRGTGELAISAALYGHDDAAKILGRFFTLESGPNGALRFDASRDGEESGSRLEKRCEIAPSAGMISARLVCADSTRVLDNLSPYLTRTVAKDAPPADVRVDLGLTALRPALDRRRDEDLAEIDRVGPADPARRAGQKFGSREGYELLRDLDSMAIEATHADAGVRIDLVLGFGGERPFLERVLTGSAARAAPAPDMFWSLPADTNMAFFSHGVDAADLEPIRASMFEVLRASVTEDEIPQPIRERLLTHLGQLFLTGGPVTIGTGSDHGRWFLVGLDEPAERWKKGIEGLIALDRQVTRATQGKKPKASDPAAHRENCERTEMKLSPAAKLGKNASHVEIKSTPIPCAENKGEKLGPPELSHAFIVPDGAARTWIAMGDDAQLLAGKIATVKANVPSETLARAPGLDALRSENMTHGGFFSLVALRRALEPRVFPFTTKTPITVAFAPRTEHDKPALAIELDFPLAVVRELVEMARSQP